MRWSLSIAGILIVAVVGVFFFPSPDGPAIVLGADTTENFTTAGYTTWTVPANVYSAKIACWGGGGAGFDGSTSGGGRGGGGGAFASTTVAVTPAGTIRLFIGAGGTTSGANGATTTASTTAPALLVSASPGTGGKNATTLGGEGGLSSLSTGDVKFAGGRGGAGNGTDDAGGGGGGAGGPAGAGEVGADASGTAGGAGGRGNNTFGGTSGTAGNGGACGTGGTSTNGGGGGGGADNGLAGCAGGTRGGGGGGGETGEGDGAAGACSITYNATPTVALNSPADAATGVSVTPTLNFTGTDAESETVEYQVQVDTANGFGLITITSAEGGVTNVQGESGTNAAKAQEFLASSGGLLSTGIFQIRKEGAPTDNFYAEISSTLGGSVLATSANISGASLTTSLASVTFDFSGAALTLTQGNSYFIAFKRSGARSTTDYFVIGSGADNGYSDGYVWTLNTGVWSQVASGLTDLHGTLQLSPLLDKLSVTPDTGFTAGHPFTSGVAKDFTVQAGDTLANSTVYYWRVRAADTVSNTYGAWSSTRSFTTTAGGAPAEYKPQSLYWDE